MKLPGAVLALPFLAASTAQAQEPPKAPTIAKKCSSPACAKRPSLEVAFVLDATGSMGPYINEARERIKEIATELSGGDPAPEVKFALVTYRDRGDAFVTKVDPFSTDIADIKNHLDKTVAGGGGDTPEAVLEGIEAALTKLKWSSNNEHVIKMAYLVGDAPAKHYDDGPTEKAMTRLARKKGIVLHTIACGRNLGPEGDKTWGHLARLTEGRALRLTETHRRRHEMVDPASTTTGDFATVVGGTSKAYSSSVGVDYDSAPALSTRAMTAPGTETSFRTGLLGAHVRWVRDPMSWTDLWAAHVSVLPPDERPPIPKIDFAAAHVLVTGGAEKGLAVNEIRGALGSRAATIKPLASGGVAFVIIPRAGGTDR